MAETDAYLAIIHRFIDHDLVTAARLIEDLDEADALAILQALPSETAVRVIRNLQIGFVATLMEGAGHDFIHRILPLLSPQMLTAILMHGSEPFREKIKGLVSQAVQDQIRELMTYPEGSVGRIITTDFLSFDKDVLVQDAIEKIRSMSRLHINLVTAFMAATVVAMFEDVISKLTILAVFLPVVAGQGGNAGAQSLAVVIRGIAMREIPKEKTGRLILKEGGLGAINGLVIGLVTALVAWIWNGNPYLGVVIGLGMFLNLIFAGLSGASIPLFLKKVGIDPAQSSSIILTTVTDILGFLAFLGFAVMFQSYLV